MVKIYSFDWYKTNGTRAERERLKTLEQEEQKRENNLQILIRAGLIKQNSKTHKWIVK